MEQDCSGGQKEGATSTNRQMVALGRAPLQGLRLSELSLPLGLGAACLQTVLCLWITRVMPPLRGQDAW
jgi:hypothetical protein